MKTPPERSPDKRSKRSERDGPARQAASLESPVLAARGLTLDAFGNRALLSLLRSGQLQRKARVSEPGDPLEHDADRAADEIVSGRHSHQVRPAPAAEIQRKPTEEETLTSALGLDSESGRVAPADPPSGSAATPASGESGSGASGAPFNPDPPRPGGGPGPRSPTAHELMSGLGGGEPLPHDMRGFMESRFGESFEDVRIHAGDRAGAAASSVSARAFTVGSDIVFGPDEYTLHSTEGTRLLAHELTHVVQQRKPVGHAASEPSTEAEADEAGHEAAYGRRVEVTTRAEPGDVQRQPKIGAKDGMEGLEPSSRVDGDTVFVSGCEMAMLPNGGQVKTTGEFWNKARRVYSVTVSHINRSTWKQSRHAERDARLMNIMVVLTAEPVAVGRSQTISINAGPPKPPGPKPPQQQPPQPPQPGQAPKDEAKTEEAADTRPHAVGDRVKKVEQKSESDPKGALKEAEDLSPGELTSLGPQPRKALLRAAADASRDSNAPQVAHDLLTTTPDRDAGALSDALKADGGKLLDELKRNETDPHGAAALDDAAQDLEGRRLDAPLPKLSIDKVELTPEMEKKANEIRQLLKKVGARAPGWDENLEKDPNWAPTKAKMEADFQRQLGILERETARWDAAHKGDTSAAIAASARADAQKGFAAMRAAKTEGELFEGFKQARHALWRANQSMDAKRQLENVESAVGEWNKTQEGWSRFASMPSHAFAGASMDRRMIAAQARADIQRAQALMVDARTPEEMARAATQLKHAIANANFQLTGHKEEVYGGAEDFIVGIKVVAVTSAAVVAPQYVIPGIIVGGGLGAARQGVQMLDDPNKQFSGMEVFDSAVVGGFLGPVAAHPAGLVVLTGLGAGSGTVEMLEGNTYTAIFDFGTAALPIAAKGASGKNIQLPGGRWVRTQTLVVMLKKTSLGLEEVPGLGGRNPTASFPTGPRITWVAEGSAPTARTPGGIYIPGAAAVEPAAPQGLPRAAGNWQTVKPSTGPYIPYDFPVVVRPGQAATDAVDAALSPDAAYQGGTLQQFNRVRTTGSGRQLLSLDSIPLTATQRQAATQVHGQRMAAAHQLAWQNTTNPREAADLAEINRLWNLGDQVSREQARDIARDAFNRHRGRYWRAVQGDPALRASFEAAGMRFTGGATTAPIYDLPDGTVARMTLEHSVRLADDPARALRGDNLQFVLDDENSAFLEFIRANDPFQQ